MKLTDEHLETFHEQGYVVVEDFYPEGKRAQIAAEVRLQMPTWEQIKDTEPDKGRGTADFPYEEQFFNQLILDQGSLEVRPGRNRLRLLLVLSPSPRASMLTHGFNTGRSIAAALRSSDGVP